MMRFLASCALTVSVLSVPARAQRDEDPIPYEDERETITASPKSLKRSGETLREEEADEVAGEETLTHLDDPNVGVGFEVSGGLLLLESSRGALADPGFSFGLRVTWEWGRLIPDEYLREMFFADLAWQFSSYSEGTAQIRTDSSYHDFCLAPAVALPLGKSAMSVYGQLGLGFNLAFMSQYIDTQRVDLSGTKFLLQYGIGLRGRPALTADGSVRLTFRVELMRFLRGYMTDTLLGVGAGVLF